MMNFTDNIGFSPNEIKDYLHICDNSVISLKKIPVMSFQTLVILIVYTGLEKWSLIRLNLT